MASASTVKIRGSGKPPLRLLAACGVVAPIFFTVLVVILGAIRPGFSHVTQPISELGEVGAPNAIVQDINFVVFGVLSLAFALGIHRGINGGRGSRIGPSLVALAGVIWAGPETLFPSSRFLTLTGTLHNVFGLVSFAALAGAALIFSRRLGRDNQWESYRFFSLVAGLLMIVFLVAFIVTSAGFPYYRGVAQRLLVGTFFLWIEVLAIRLFRISSPLYLPAHTQDEGTGREF